jgi:excisionase family DNA binding protein
MGTDVVSPLGLTVKQAAKTTTLHEQTIRQLLRDGRIRSVRVGRRHVIPRTELERFLSVEAQPA